MKRSSLSILLALCLILSLTACSFPGRNSEKAEQDPSSSQDAQNDPAAEETKSDEPVDTSDFKGPVDLDNAVTPPDKDFLYYEFNNYVELYGYQGRDNIIVIPNTLAGKPVYCGYVAFSEGTDVHGVVIGEGFEEIIAFEHEHGGAHVEAIRIPSTVTEAPSQNPFYNLRALQTIEVAPGNTCFMVENGALYTVYSDSRTLLCYPAALPGETFVQPDGSGLADDAFNGTVNLKRLENANGSGSKPYRGSSLEEIIFSDRTTYLSQSLFVGAENLRSVTLSVNLDSHVGNSHIFKDNGKMEEVIVPEGNREYFSDDGVLYKRNADYQYLMYYPTARPGEEYTLAPGTTGIYDVDYVFDNPLYLKVLHSGGADLGRVDIDGIEYREP